MRLAMWSGPRNLSTAMMYAFAQRPDFEVWDEPFYGPYLRLTGLDHPMREAVLASRPEGPVEVEQRLLAPLSQLHVYHKHMCQHMIPGIPRGFMAECVNVFLIRHPARVVASFTQGFPQAGADDIGFAAQAELFDHVRALGQEPVVVDSADIRDDPEGMLRALCDAIGLDWNPVVLSWPAGPKPYDGAWAPAWYRSLHGSTGFAGPEGPLPVLEGRARALTDEAMPHFERMAARALKI
ncbi:HAD family hydrolase [Thetidibacter halocola]|uniref:HAD family hydrolase n=1 Tax=Thetidibacter halocola TaxID=2827239 RepID=A0A8J7W9P9_9RHOB|nr:HAD family hydrolase [Thetidibacter halocola]MBS0123485.1 HAD family hydrolase [Thetidibacter halocola]